MNKQADWMALTEHIAGVLDVIQDKEGGQAFYTVYLHKFGNRARIITYREGDGRMFTDDILDIVEQQQPDALDVLIYRSKSPNQAGNPEQTYHLKTSEPNPGESIDLPQQVPEMQGLSGLSAPSNPASDHRVWQEFYRLQARVEMLERTLDDRDRVIRELEKLLAETEKENDRLKEEVETGELAGFEQEQQAMRWQQTKEIIELIVPLLTSRGSSPSHLTMPDIPPTYQAPPQQARPQPQGPPPQAATVRPISEDESDQPKPKQHEDLQV